MGYLVSPTVLLALQIFKNNAPPLAAWEISRLSSAPQGHYNDLASLFLNTNDDAIQNPFSGGTDNEFQMSTLFIFFAAIYCLGLVTYGIAVRSSLHPYYTGWCHLWPNRGDSSGSNLGPRHWSLCPFWKRIFSWRNYENDCFCLCYSPWIDQRSSNATSSYASPCIQNSGW